MPVTCPNCQRRYSPGPEHAGKRIKCRCGARFGIPAEEPAPDQYQAPEYEDNYNWRHGIVDEFANPPSPPIEVPKVTKAPGPNEWTPAKIGGASVAVVLAIIALVLTIKQVDIDAEQLAGYACVITLFGLLVAVLLIAVFEKPKAKRGYYIICPNVNCGYRGNARSIRRGDNFAEGFLLLFEFPLGVFYSTMTRGYRRVCPQCGLQIASDG